MNKSTNKIIRVGSRASALAIIQAQIVIDAVKKTRKDLEFEIVKIKTTGDKILDRNLDDVGGKGLFIKELEHALIDRRIDIAVHSYKDMPFDETDGLPVVALSKRESPFDVLVLPSGVATLDKSKPVGSSSRRREIQFAKLYNDIAIKSVRGNVPSRISKLDSGEYSALILAHAGLNRLGLQDRVSKIFTIDEMIPAASQGILAVQGRAGEEFSFLDDFHCRESELVSLAERQFIKTLGGGCSSAVAAYGRINDNKLLLTGMYVDECGNVKTATLCDDIDKSKEIGERLAIQLSKKESVEKL